MTTATSPNPAITAQNLATGTIGTALLTIERARHGDAPWGEVHGVLASCTSNLITSEEHGASLYFGAPAVAFVVHTASAGTSRYAETLRRLDTEISAMTRRRLAHAHNRIDRRVLPRLAEFDLFYGLTGLGAYFMARGSDHAALRAVLAYLVRLTEPLADGLPGWWSTLGTSGGSSPSPPGGHGNAGMAHGICGPLTLLALARLRGVEVAGQRAAIRRICCWLDTIRHDAAAGPWWPEWITHDEQVTGTITRARPSRPGWCYGIAGQARAQQLAALALNDNDRQYAAEHALLTALSDPDQLALLTDAGLCHGVAGTLHTTRRVAADAPAGMFDDTLERLGDLLAARQPPSASGLLDGPCGIELVRRADAAHGRTRSGWDTCLLAGPTRPEDSQP